MNFEHKWLISHLVIETQNNSARIKKGRNDKRKRRKERKEKGCK